MPIQIMCHRQLAYFYNSTDFLVFPHIRKYFRCGAVWSKTLYIYTARNLVQHLFTSVDFFYFVVVNKWHAFVNNTDVNCELSIFWLGDFWQCIYIYHIWMGYSWKSNHEIIGNIDHSDIKTIFRKIKNGTNVGQPLHRCHYFQRIEKLLKKTRLTNANKVHLIEMKLMSKTILCSMHSKAKFR